MELIEGINPLPNVTGRVCPQELQCSPAEFVGDEKTHFVNGAILEVMELGEPDASGGAARWPPARPKR